MSAFILSLKKKEIVHCMPTGEHSLTLHHSQDSKPLYFSGMFSDAIVSLQTTSPHTKRLQQIEQTYPHLQGLSQATYQTSKPKHLLLGQSLGILFVELTSQCNERCVHCYAESSPERQDFLSFDDVCRSLQQARELGRPFVQFTGGDPLIHRDLIRIIQFTHQLDFQGIEVYTNGLLLSDTLLSELHPYHPQLSFSIYADCAEVHDKITRVQGSWKRTLAAMQRSIEQGFDVRTGVVIMQENAEHIAELPFFLQQTLGLSPEHIRFDPVNTVGRAITNHLPEHIHIQSSHAIAQGETRRGKLCVAANGDVYPCIFSRQLRLGNIRNSDLAHILEALQYRDMNDAAEARRKTCQEQLSCSDCQMIASLLTTPHALGDPYEPSFTRLPYPS